MSISPQGGRLLSLRKAGLITLPAFLLVREADAIVPERLTLSAAGITLSSYNQRTNGPVNAHLSLLHIPINMFENYGI